MWAVLGIQCMAWVFHVSASSTKPWLVLCTNHASYTLWVVKCEISYTSIIQEAAVDIFLMGLAWEFGGKIFCSWLLYKVDAGFGTVWQVLISSQAGELRAKVGRGLRETWNPNIQEEDVEVCASYTDTASSHPYAKLKGLNKEEKDQREKMRVWPRWKNW